MSGAELDDASEIEEKASLRGSLGSPTFDGEAVPESVARLFWDTSQRPLELRRHLDLLIRRVLDEGSWEACRWLRRVLGDAALGAHLRRVGGRGLERRTLRLWQVLLQLPAAEVDAWLADQARSIWDRRVS